MSKLNLLQEILETYQRHGWKLRSLLVTEELQSEANSQTTIKLPFVPLKISTVNALWFSRASGNREAWELRLLSASPYALFETFALNISDIEREQACEAMENRLRTQIAKFRV
jgi:hypothetical protein